MKDDIAGEEGKLSQEQMRSTDYILNISNFEQGELKVAFFLLLLN